MGGFVSAGLDLGLNMVSGGLWDKTTGGGLSGGFKNLGPKAVPVTPVSLPPELDTDAQAERDEAARRERERRLATGRASTVLTGGLGDVSEPTLASAILLGQ